MSQPVAHSVDSCIAEVVLVQLGHQTQRHEDRHFPDRNFNTAASSLLLTSQHSLVLVTLVHALSDLIDGFLLRSLGVSLWPCPGSADSR